MDAARAAGIRGGTQIGTVAIWSEYAPHGVCRVTPDLTECARRLPSPRSALNVRLDASRLWWAFVCRLTLVVTRVEPGQTKELIRARLLCCRLVVCYVVGSGGGGGGEFVGGPARHRLTIR